MGHYDQVSARISSVAIARRTNLKPDPSYMRSASFVVRVF